MLSYNYIIFGSHWDFYKHAYSDVIKLKNVHYIGRLVNNIFFRILYLLHNSHRINTIITLPYRDLWFKRYIKTNFSERKPLVFIIFADWCCINNRLVNYLSSKYPQAKKILIFNDLVHTKIDTYTTRPLDITKLKKNFDLILSFDFGDSQKYGIEYYPIPYSVPHQDLVSEEKDPSDIYFLGQAKNRLAKIIDTFRYLKSMGLKTNFIISGVRKKDQISESGIRFVKNNEVSYEENLKYIANTKCILEIMQKGGSGYTSRTLEAICYGKKLLTNNQSILNAPFYNNEYISYIKDLQSFDKKFLDNLKDNDTVDYKYKENLSPLKLLEFIENKLKEESHSKTNISTTHT